MATNNDEAAQYKPLTITRVFDAPRELVWRAWTEPEQFAQWWSPDGFTIPVCEMDMRPGGHIRVVMEGFGMRSPSEGTVKELVEPERLAVLTGVQDDKGHTIFEVLQTVTLAEKGDQTELRIVSEVVSATPEAAPYLKGMESGLTQALGKLEHVLREM